MQEAADNFFRSLGLDAENDWRPHSLLQTMLARFRHMEPDTIEEDEIVVGVFGITLGLLLAQATGWEPPLEG